MSYLKKPKEQGENHISDTLRLAQKIVVGHEQYGLLYHEQYGLIYTDYYIVQIYIYGFYYALTLLTKWLLNKMSHSMNPLPLFMGDEIFVKS